MTRFRFPCVDDRGVLVPRGWLMSRRAVRRAGIDEATRRAALRGVNRESGRYGGRMGLIMGVPVVLIAGASDRVPWPITMGTVLLLATLTRSIAWPRFWPRFTAALRTGWLEQGRCPACGACLAGIEPQEDSRRVCPECGSAWKMDEDASPPPS